MALKRDAQTLYEPIVIAHPKGYRVISMYSLLMAQQDKLQDLYTEVHYLSIKDPLSLINNRRGFFDAVNQKLTTIRDFDLEYAVMMIDIDSFKSVNDRYGHLVGDEVLKAVAQRIDYQLRENDISGRFGGDEFVVFIMGISKEAAINLAEKIRQDIASVFHMINGFQIRVSISIGVSHSRGANNTLDRLLCEADQAVYVSKKMGRNKATMWAEGLGEPTTEPRNRRTVRSKTSVQEEQIQEQTLQGWLHMLYFRDYETEAHTKRVSELAMNLAKRAEVAEEEYEGIRVGALLHDIGKIGIPDNILFGEKRQVHGCGMADHAKTPAIRLRFDQPHFLFSTCPGYSLLPSRTLEWGWLPEGIKGARNPPGCPYLYHCGCLGQRLVQTGLTGPPGRKNLLSII